MPSWQSQRQGEAWQGEQAHTWPQQHIAQQHLAQQEYLLQQQRIVHQQQVTQQQQNVHQQQQRPLDQHRPPQLDQQQHSFHFDQHQSVAQPIHIDQQQSVTQPMAQSTWGWDRNWPVPQQETPTPYLFSQAQSTEGEGTVISSSYDYGTRQLAVDEVGLNVIAINEVI